jgi:membrane dipeptidase
MNQLFVRFLIFHILFYPLLPLKAQIKGFIDIHNSSLFRLLNQQDLHGLYQENVPVSIPQLKKLETRWMVFSVGIPFLSSSALDSLDIADVLAFFKQFKTHYKQDLQWVGNIKALKNAQKQAKIPYIFALEGTHLLKGNIQWLDSLHQAGVRIITLGHWFHNAFVVSPQDTLYVDKNPTFLNKQSVLSGRGKAFITRMATLGMALDVSHLPEQVITEILALHIPRLVMFASHSNSYLVYPNGRNLSDAQIERISQQEGLIGICFHQSTIGDNSEDSIQKLVLHIQHIIQIAGKKHLAFGTDYEGGITPPKALQKLENLELLVNELHKQGISKKTIQNICWKNAYRFLKRNILQN